MDMDNENIPRSIANLSCDEQLEISLLAFELAGIRSNKFISFNECKPIVDKLTDLISSIEDRQDLVSPNSNRFTVPKQAIEPEKELS